MDQSDDLKSTYNRIAEDWMQDHAKDTWWIAGTEKFLSFLKQGQSVLDVGCAGGLKSEYITKKGFVVTGIDMSDKMIELAQSRLPLQFFFVRDICEPLRLKGKFDGVFAQAVLLHIPKKEVRQALSNLTDALNPGGFLYVAVKKRRDGAPEEELVEENDYGYEYKRFFSFYTLEELEGCFKELGLKTVYSDVTSIGSTNWIQIIGQKHSDTTF